MGNDNTKTDTTRAHHTAGDNDLPQDLRKIHRYRGVIKNVAEERGIDPAVIAAIISQEQIQLDNDPEKTICEVTNKLFECIKAIRSECPTWTKEQQFKGGIVKYKGKPVRSCRNVDEYTTCGNYSNDVLDKAKWFRRNIDFQN